LLPRTRTIEIKGLWKEKAKKKKKETRRQIKESLLPWFLSDNNLKQAQFNAVLL
jgi:hypothetical protein